jgi:hypothetical protein
MPRGGDPTAAQARRNLESASALPDRLTIVDVRLGVCEVHLTRETSFELYKLLDVRPDNDGVLYAVELKSEAPATAGTVRGVDRIN